MERAATHSVSFHPDAVSLRSLPGGHSLLDSFKKCSIGNASLVFNFLLFLPRRGVLALLLMLHLIDVVMDCPELFRVGMER